MAVKVEFGFGELVLTLHDRFEDIGGSKTTDAGTLAHLFKSTHKVAVKM